MSVVKTAVWNRRDALRKTTCGLLLIGLTLVAAPPTSRAAQPQEQRELINKLAEMWRAQEQEIHTAYVRGHRHILGPILLPLRPDEVNRILDAHDLTSGLPALVATLQDLIGRPPRKPRSPFTYYQSGAKRREETSTGHVQVFDGETHVIRDSANNQAHVFAPGQSRRYQSRLSDLRRVPRATDVFLANVQVVAIDGARAHLRTQGDFGRADFVFDVTTGMLLRQVSRNATGTVRSELRQFGHATYPGDIVFPSLIADCDYSDAGTLKRMRLTVIEEARFNEELPDETFDVGLTGGAILDFRDPDHTRSAFIPEDVRVPDVVERMGRPLAVAPAAKPSTRLWWIVGVNVGIALILVGALLYRKVKSSRRTDVAH